LKIQIQIHFSKWIDNPIRVTRRFGQKVATNLVKIALFVAVFFFIHFSSLKEALFVAQQITSQLRLSKRVIS